MATFMFTLNNTQTISLEAEYAYKEINFEYPFPGLEVYIGEIKFNSPININGSLYTGVKFNIYWNEGEDTAEVSLSFMNQTEGVLDPSEIGVTFSSLQKRMILSTLQSAIVRYYLQHFVLTELC